MSRRRPGNGSATLLDMLSNLFYFSLFLARQGSTKRKRKRTRSKEGDAEREHTLLHLPATLRTRRRHFPISRQASAPALLYPPPVSPPPPSSFFLSFRLASSLFSLGERENGSEARNEKKGRKESSGRRGRWRRKVEERTRARSYG